MPIFKWNLKTNTFLLNSIFLSRLIKDRTYLNEKSIFIKNLTQQMNKTFYPTEFTEKGIIFQISRFKLNKFIELCSTYQKFLKEPAIILVEKEKQQKALALFEQLIIKENGNLQQLPYNHNLSLKTNIQNFQTKSKLLDIEIYHILLQQKDIQMSNNTFTPINLTNKQTTSETTRLGLLRESISSAFDHNSKYNLLPFNDPTGTGKTHAVIKNFLSEYPNTINKDNLINSIRKNLIFIAPLKNQLAFSSSLYTMAEHNAIPWLFLRSQEDLTNLSLKSFFKKEHQDSTHMNSQEFWENLFSMFTSSNIKNIDNKLKKFKILENKNIKHNSDLNIDLASDLDLDLLLDSINTPQISKLKLFFFNLSNFEKNNAHLKDISKDTYNDELQKAKILFQLEMKNIAMLLSKSLTSSELKNIFSSNAMYLGSKVFEQYENDKQLFILTYFLLCFALPLEVAKYLNCIIFTTGAKSQTKIPFMIPQKRNVDKSSFVSLTLEEIVSGYKLSNKVDILKYNDDFSFSKCLNNELFEPINGHYFLNNNISFSLVLDEEHILHHIFTNTNTYKTITETFANSKVNIIHAFCGIFRWKKNSLKKNRLVGNFDSIIQEKNKIVNTFYNSLKKHTILKTDGEIDKFLEDIFHNNYGCFVKLKDFDFIRSVCQHVLSFSPNHIMLKSFLQQIYMVIDSNSESIIFTKNKHEYDPELVKYSVFDFFQITLCLLHTLRDTSYSLRNELPKEQLVNGQNIAVSHMCNIAFNNKDFLENLYQSSLNLDDENLLNIQFTYFLTKIGFHFQFPEVITKTEYSPDSISVEPQIFIIKELPEVDILKILHNKNNRVFLLSATRGFQDIYAGNFTTNFFEAIDRLNPNTVRIFDRRNEPINDMDNFIIERAKHRNINVSNITFSNSSNSVTTVSEDIFTVKDFSTVNLINTNDTKPFKKTDSLFSNDVFNTSLKWANTIKNMTAFQDHNVYIQDEFLNTINAIAHTVENNKSAMIMALSNKFYEFFIKDSFIARQIFGDFKLRSPENKIIEIAISENKTLKLICYDSELGRSLNLEDEFIVEPNKITVLVSSFKSAGTGLNFTLEDKANNISKDFDSLYFVNSVYYTNINGKDKNNIFNQIIILKSFTHKGNKVLKDLEDGFLSTEALKTLDFEHYMEQVKNIMQAIGRIERRDKSNETYIYFVNGLKKELFNEIISLFNQVFQSHKNNYDKTILANFSMLNKAVLKTSINYTYQNSLSDIERNNVEHQSKNDFQKYNNFFCNPHHFPKLLKEFRACNPSYIWVDELNNIFRDYVSACYELDNKLTTFLRKHEKLLRETNFYSIILSLIYASKMNFKKHPYLLNKKITVNYDEHFYTDISHSRYLISDAYFFNYSQQQNLDIDRKSFLYGCLKQFNNHNSTSFSVLPNLYLYHLIKGNIGEKIMEHYLLSKYIPFNQLQSLFNQEVYQKTYELFDFYIVKEKTIYCIDIKNWRMYNDNAAQKTLRRLPEKVDIIQSIPEFIGFNFQYIYLNMFEAANHEYSNAMNHLMGNISNARFMNFIESETIQEPVKTPYGIKEYKRKTGKLKISQDWSETL